MPLNYFNVDRGLSLDGNVQVIATNGAPSGVEADAAAKGTIALDYLNGRLFQKGDTGTGPELWQPIGGDTNWRQESEVRDGVATVLPTFTPSTNATVDGQTITDQQRVLFSALTVDPNIYIYDFSTGTFIQSTNEATSGDVTYIVRGTDAGKKYIFNGTAWVLFDQASVDEFGFVHLFIGKSGFGSETPTYTSNNIVTNGDNLEVAIGKLDAAAAVGNVGVSLPGVLGTNTLDSVLVDVVATVQWLVTVRQGAVNRTGIIYATHDGTTGADATTVDFTGFANLTGLGVAPIGLAVTVDVSGAAGAQVMRLQVTTTGLADWHATRIPVNF